MTNYDAPQYLFV